MNGLQPNARWLARLHSRVNQAARRPRAPLWAGAAQFGSAEAGFMERLCQALPATGVMQKTERLGLAGWQINGDLTASLGLVAMVMRDNGLTHAWRDEQLAVTDGQGHRLGTIERGAVRPLGITTFAVHLVGRTADGRHWVQQRSMSKPNDPGLWDTLMGGMVPACDALADALERETWEEAGLRLGQLSDLTYGGRVSNRGPVDDVGPGYVIEHIDWFRCLVPPSLEPANQDGEVDQFRLLAPVELRDWLERDAFTTEAALVLTQTGI